MMCLDLFSGVGGFSLAASWVWGADHHIHSFVEIDPFCQKVLKKHWPGTPIHDDIRSYTIDTHVNLCYNQLSQFNKEMIDMIAKRKSYDEAVSLYEKGMSIQDVANFYGVTRQAMWMILKRRGCVFRDNLKFQDENNFYRGGAKSSSRVHNITEIALEKGILIRKIKCDQCGDIPVFANGRTGIEAHHDDYNKPLSVRWLCKKCHFEWHKNNKPIELTISFPPMTKKEICSLGGKNSHKNRKGKEEPIGDIEDATNVDLLTGGFP